MKRIIISVFLGIFLFNMLPEAAKAQQGLPVDGKDFYIGYVYPSFNKNPDQSGRGVKGFFGVYALITSYETNQVTLSYFDNNGIESQGSSYSIFAKSGIQVALQAGSMRMDEPGDIPQYRACHITAKKPVNVQYFSTGACSGGSYLAIPTPALGQQYVVPSYFDNPEGDGAGTGNQRDTASGYFMVIAAFNGTNVTITPTARTAGGHTGVNSGAGANGSAHPYVVTLNRGQCYWVKGDGTDNSADMSGSTVVADKPIALLAGHEDAFIGEAPSQRVLEGRDFMIEQVIPAEYWDNTGYVSIPLYGAQPPDPSAGGYGSNYRIYTDNKNGAQTVLQDCRGPFTMPVSRYSYPQPEKTNIDCPIDVFSTDGHKFGVMLYQLRDQGGKEPYPAESMMSIVPMSRWRTSYLFYVPANTFELLQDYYINVIAEKADMDLGNIRYAFNGGNLSKLASPKAAFTNIPNHPELKGATYIVHPGSYYLTNIRTKLFKDDPIDSMLQGAFMVYHYGMRAIDPDRDLGDFCGDDFFFSYALPIGMTVAGTLGNPKVTVDTFCNHWHVTVRDSIPLTSATLIDDAEGNVYGKPGKVYFNALFDPNDDPDNKREIVFRGTDTLVQFDVLVSNPFDSAYAPIIIYDKHGTHIIIELRYQAPSAKLSLLPNLPPALDSLGFPNTMINQQVCSTLVYINTAKVGGASFHINSVKLQKNIDFQINSISPGVPATLKPGDTLKVEVCYTAKDTVYAQDSIIAQTDCSEAPLLAIGKGATPLIYATDIDFGNVAVGTTLCKPLTVSNKGSVPFMLTVDWVLHNIKEFKMDPQSAAKLPVPIPPGGHINLTFCYTPTQIGQNDSTSTDWATDVDNKYANQIKKWSYLKGTPIKPGVVWDRPKQDLTVICEDTALIRVWLKSTANTKTLVNQVYFGGADASEFTIAANQFNYSPFGNFSINPGDSMWVDVKFGANLAKTGAALYAPRKADLIATFVSEGAAGGVDSTVLPFTGFVQHSELTFNPSTYEFNSVVKGSTNTGFVSVTNIGDAPFVIRSEDIRPPITQIVVNGKVLSPGDTIYPGAMVSFVIDFVLNDYIDTTVSYTLFSDHLCGNYTAFVHGSASSLKVLGTGYPAPNVFVGCREHDSSVVFTNLGSVPITLTNVDIIASTPPGQFDLVASNGTKTTGLVLKDTLKLNETVTIPIIYHPTVAGLATATIQYTYDSAGTKFKLTKQATGVGIFLRTLLSAREGGQYHANTGATFTVPISMVDSILPSEADVRHIKFRFTYDEDVVDYVKSEAANPDFTINAPGKNTAGNNMEYRDYDLTSTKPITSLGNLINVTYTAMVAQRTVSPFIISNVELFDSKGQSICYVAVDTLPGVFVPDPLCGDTTLRNYLNGTFPTRISMLSPGVVGKNESPVLYYSVNRTGVPVRVEVYNVLGEKVRTIKNTPTQPIGDYKLPIGAIGLPSGQYIVRLITPGSAESANFIIEK